MGLPVVAYEECLKKFPPESFEMFIAIGSSHVNRKRITKYNEVKAKGYKLASYISKDAAVHADQVGDNCLIMDYNNIHPYVKVGSNIIFSNSNHIGHHSVIQDHCFITSNVVVGGGVTIGEGSFLGINATIRDHVSIGKSNVIGAGAIILHDTQDGEVYSVESTPARKCKSDRLKDL